MPDEVRFAAKILPKREMLEISAEDLAHRPILVIETTPGYIATLRRFAAEHDITNLEFLVREYPQDWTERAKNFMFAVRDQLAIASDDTTREYKEHLYEMAKRECGLVDEGGKVRSIKTMSKGEVWQLTHMILDWAEEAGVDRQQFSEELRRLHDDQRTDAVRD